MSLGLSPEVGVCAAVLLAPTHVFCFAGQISLVYHATKERLFHNTTEECCKRDKSIILTCNKKKNGSTNPVSNGSQASRVQPLTAAVKHKKLLQEDGEQDSDTVRNKCSVVVWEDVFENIKKSLVCKE